MRCDFLCVVKRRRSAWISLLVSLTVLLLSLSGCETTVEDVRRWENAKGSKEKMEEYLLGENTAAVKAEAVMVLIRRGEGSHLMAILPKTTQAEREAIAAAVAPQLDKMLDDESQSVQVRGKDGAYYLCQVDSTQELKERLRDVMVRWVDGDNFWRPLESVGDIDKSKIFEETGVKGLPVIKNALNDRFDKIDEAKTDGRKLKLMQDIQGIVALAEGLNLAETDAIIAQLFIARAEAVYPDLLEVYGIPFLANKSPELKAFASRVMLDPNYKSADLNALRDIIINEYYVKVQTKEGVLVCGTVLRKDESGFLRWMCARTLLKVAKDAGVDHVFLGMPDDPAKLVMPADHPLAGSYNVERYYWEEAESFCRSLKPLLGGEVPLEKVRGYLTGERTVQRLLAITCLSYHGTETDMATLRSMSADRTNIEAWKGGTETLGEYALAAAEAHTKRVSAE